MNLSWFRDGTKWVASGVGPGSSQASEKAGIWVVSMFGGTPRQLRTDSDGAVVSPDGAHIAFRTTKGDPEIWVMDADGSAARKLVSAGPREHFGKLQWSPDGKRLAYIRYRTQPGSEIEIDSREIDSEQTSVILTEPGLKAFCWVPDGRIIYSRRDPPPGTDMNLWELRVKSNGRASGTPHQVTQWAGFVISDLGVTGDGKRLVFIREAYQTDVYIGQLTGASLQRPQRLTLDEWLDVPSAWTPDGSAVLFSSNRNGNWGIYREAAAGADPEQVAGGTEDQTDARLDPDRTSILYWAKATTGAQKAKLLRIPLGGGPAQPVLEAASEARFRCGARAGARCVLSELTADGKQLTFTGFDPQRGRGQTLAQVSVESSAAPEWDLSPDGTTIAVVATGDSKNDVRLLTLNGGAVRFVPLTGDLPATAVAWALDGASLFVVTGSVRGSALLKVGLDGTAQQLWTGKALVASAPTPSPDGSRIAFAGSTYQSNVWMIEGF